MQVTGWGADPGEDSPPQGETQTAVQRLASATSASESRIAISTIALALALIFAVIGGFWLSIPIGCGVTCAGLLLVAFLYGDLIGGGS